MKPKLRELIFIALLMGIPIGAYVYVLKPQNRANAEMMTQIQARQDKLRQLNRVTGTIGDLQKQIAERREAIDFFQTRLPNEKEIDKVLQEVWRLAEENKLTTKSIRTLTRTDLEQGGTSGPKEQPIAVMLEGDFDGFYAFLQALENRPRIMQVRKMLLTTDELENTGAVQAGFEMCVFFEQEENQK